MAIVYLLLGLLFGRFLRTTRLRLIDFKLFFKTSKPKENTRYEFKERLSERYGLFIECQTGEELIFKIDDASFKEEHFYEYVVEERVNDFWIIGNPIKERKFWKVLSYP